MKLSHPLRDLLGCLRDPQLLGRQRTSLKVLFKSSVLESSQHAGSNVLASQTTQNLQFLLSIDKMIDLRAVDTQQ